MPYAIPANIKYEEKLVGPLTIKQSIYLAIGLLAAGYISLSDKLPIPLPGPVKILISGVILLITAGFVQFNLDVWLKNYLDYMGQNKKTSWLSPAARQLMNIRSIRADATYLKNKSVLAVIKVKPINFGVLSEQDKDTVIYGFLEFLNGLNFSIQIVMRSINLDLEDYLRHLKRRILQRDDKVALAYYEHFAEYMRSYIKVNKINDRHFYIVVPGQKKGSEKETVDYLETQCEEIKARLALSGIVSERLNTSQLRDFYSTYFTETFEVYETIISPITMYRRMWKNAPKPVVGAGGTIDERLLDKD
ncbi:MAG: PrgI family protein [Candidatus Altiarchaeota archaeon]|nr:PrgI family protein [Candidatus Altiarchaeota archaeon]